MNPIRPGSHKFPTNQRLNVSLAFTNNKQRFQEAAFKVNQVIASIPSKKVDADKAPRARKDEKRTATLKANAHRYEYQLDADVMDRTMAAIERILQTDILSGSDFWTARFFLNDYLKSAMEDGTLDSFQSALNITKGTSAEASLAILTAEQQLNTAAYMDRLRLAYGRVFESMKGLTADVKGQLRVTLTEGVARGLSIQDLKGMMNKRLGVGMSRAERIVRTEINHVYRTAYMDEAKEINETALKDDEWMIMQTHRSAISPTSREHHVARHGSIHTMEEQREWWSVGANSINCLCSTLDVLVNKSTGEVLQQNMVEGMIKQRKAASPN